MTNCIDLVFELFGHICLCSLCSPQQILTSFLYFAQVSAFYICQSVLLSRACLCIH